MRIAKIKVINMNIIVTLAIFGVISYSGLIVESKDLNQRHCVTLGNTTDYVGFYKCYAISNYLESLVPLPSNTSAISFTYSTIPVLRNRSFARFGQSLHTLIFYYVELVEIEDEAFQGIPKIELLFLIGNNLEVIKGKWFDNLPELHALSLAENHIKQIQGDFFTRLNSQEFGLSIANNELTCLPREEFRAKYDSFEEILLHGNHWTPECLAWFDTFWIPKAPLYSTPTAERGSPRSTDYPENEIN
ncbi:phospholipase A2 inhibitor-like [Athalia rosae]|uniref:phospholipase A2 inhibitor-like n=1 Tax=Athalia rosae TaxID=37344 RepID=UPI0020345CE6|nr:phospholipase A2 inhibitor-like [Athalia rosae]